MYDNDTRKAGDYDIIQSMRIGDREIVIGENQEDKNGQKYMTAFCEWNEVFALYTELLVSDDYAEIVKYFGERLVAQAEKTRDAIITPTYNGEDIDTTPIGAEQCSVISSKDDINGKIIVIKPEAMQREYRAIQYQLLLCNGGFGASSNSRGSAVFCNELFSGKSERLERNDILGTLDPDQLPEWAKERLSEIKQKSKTKDKEAR